MHSILVVVTDIFREQPLQVPFGHGNHVIQQISTTALLSLAKMLCGPKLARFCSQERHGISLWAIA